MTEDGVARLWALVTEWRDKARLARPLESAPLDSVKRARTAEWIFYTNRANEVEAILKSSTDKR